MEASDHNSVTVCEELHRQASQHNLVYKFVTSFLSQALQHNFVCKIVKSSRSQLPQSEVCEEKYRFIETLMRNLYLPFHRPIVSFVKFENTTA